ncbi:MAG: sulfotransferase domain-containing protein [Nitrospirae bacterium]|nr:sulfotransferase domain-containing protein [Nitrospirota bacterium]
MLPNFICIGTGRAGTSWLYKVLLEHREVCTAKNIKETQFFNIHYEKGVGWYKKFFEDCGKASAVGEISNRYIFDPAVPERIRKTVPDCKIIICLRNPYERIQSVYSFKLRGGR